MFRATERNKFSFGYMNSHLEYYTPISHDVNAMLENLQVTDRGSKKVNDAIIAQDPPCDQIS